VIGEAGCETGVFGSAGGGMTNLKYALKTGQFVLDTLQLHRTTMKAATVTVTAVGCREVSFGIVRSR
jgi:hypothetical protein